MPGRHGSEAGAIAGSYAICGGIAAPLLLVGASLTDQLAKVVVEALATLPLVSIHAVKESLVERRFKLPTPGRILGSGLSTHSGEWIRTGIVCGALVGLFDNTV